MTTQQIKDNAPEGATHTNGKSFYMYESFYEDQKGDWYRWVESRKAWSELLSKPRNIKPL